MTHQIDNIEELNRTVEFRNAAVADGWIIKPTYEGHEPMESAATLNKDGYTMSILARDNSKQFSNAKRKYECSVSLWGPDGLHIDTPAFTQCKQL